MKKARDISKGPFWKLIEMELIGASDRGCVLQLHVKKKNLHAYDRVHGGS